MGDGDDDDNSDNSDVSSCEMSEGNTDCYLSTVNLCYTVEKSNGHHYYKPSSEPKQRNVSLPSLRRYAYDSLHVREGIWEERGGQNYLV